MEFNSVEILKLLVTPLQPSNFPIYFAECCDVVFVGGDKPSHCSTCKKTANPILIQNITEFETFLTSWEHLKC